MVNRSGTSSKRTRTAIVGNNLSVLTMTSMIGTFGNGTWTFLMPLYLVIIGVPAVFVGVIYTAIAGSSTIAPLLGGSLADRIGRKPILILSQVIHVPLLLVIAFASSSLVAVVLALVAWRFLGVMSAPARMTLIAESSGKKGKESAYATWRALTDAVTISSPLIGGFLLYSGHFSFAFLISAILSAVSALIRYRFLRETKHTLNKERNPFRIVKLGFKDLKANRVIISLTAVSILVAFLSGMSEYLIPIFSGEILKIGSAYIGLLFSIQIGVTASVLNLGAKLSKKIGRINLILVGVLISSLFEVLFTQSFDVAIALVLFGAWMFFDIMTHPAISAFQYDAVNRERSSTDLGSMSTLSSLVSTAAPASGMLLFLAMPRSPFYIAAALTAIAYLYLWVVSRRNERKVL